MASVIGTGAFQRSWSDARVREPHSSLNDLVEREIIPRLMLAHDVDAPTAHPADISQVEIDALAPLALCASADLLLDRIDQFLNRGLTIEQVMVHLLAPTARRLGTWWEEDRCDFVEVTMGLWRLQEVVREIVMRATPAWPGGGVGSRRALFSAAPGEQHDFGPIMVSETFRLAGWDVDTVIGGDMSELLERVASSHLDIVGLTVSCDCHSGRLPSIIHALRSVSRNPRLRILVGGRVFCENPALAVEIGADGTAPDASAAVLMAEGLVDALERAAAA